MPADGSGRLVAPRTLELALNDGGTRMLVGERLFINIGTRATTPDVPGLEAARPLTHVEALDAGGPEVLFEVRYRRRAGDEQDALVAVEQPGVEGHVALRAETEDILAAAVDDAVAVLHSGDVDELESLRNLGARQISVS